MKNTHALLCERTTHKGMPCLADINTLAGLCEPCLVCAKSLQKMRDVMGWVPFRERFYMSNKLAGSQHDALLDRISAATKDDSAEIEEIAFKAFAQFHPHEAHAQWPDRFWGYFQSLAPGKTREEMEAMLTATESEQ